MRWKRGQEPRSAIKVEAQAGLARSAACWAEMDLVIQKRVPGLRKRPYECDGWPKE